MKNLSLEEILPENNVRESSGRQLNNLSFLLSFLILPLIKGKQKRV